MVILSSRRDAITVGEIKYSLNYTKMREHADFNLNSTLDLLPGADLRVVMGCQLTPKKKKNLYKVLLALLENKKL